MISPNNEAQVLDIPARKSPRASAASRTSGSSRFTLLFELYRSGDGALVTLLLPSRSIVVAGLSDRCEFIGGGGCR